MPNLTRKYNYSEKKTLSIAAARVKHSDVAATTLQELFCLPKNAVITNAFCVVEVAGQSNLTVDFGFDGGAELGNDLDIDAAGYVAGLPVVSTLTTLTGTVTALTLAEGTPNTLTSGTVALTSGAGTVTAAPRLLTGTGKTVTAKFSADPSAGEFVFVVEFIEYDVGNGNLMNYSAN